MKRFPCGQYGRQRLQFFPAPYRSPLRAFAALVFPWADDRVLVCDIDKRGWSIPSGTVEPSESSLEAVRREAVEEGGAVLGDIQYIGCYQISERREVRWADCFVAPLIDLVDIGMTHESKGRRLVTIDELPAIYHLWNPLTRMVFEHSYEILQRRLRLSASEP
jgi:8-oxo-dGTP diphosphatase